MKTFKEFVTEADDNYGTLVFTATDRYKEVISILVKGLGGGKVDVIGIYPKSPTNPSVGKPVNLSDFNNGKTADGNAEKRDQIYSAVKNAYLKSKGDPKVIERALAPLTYYKFTVHK